MDPIKCTVLIDKPATPETQGELKIEFEHLDGSPMSANEADLVDIGRDRWPNKYGMDGTPIDTFTWSMLDMTDDINSKWLRRASAVCFRTMGLLIEKKYQQIRDPNIWTHFRDHFTHDLSVFGDREGVLAHAFLFQPNMNKNYMGLTEWNDNHFFTPFGDALEAYLVDDINYTEGELDNNGFLKKLATQPWLEIDMHEKKHNHGYWHHLKSLESLMAPFVKRGYTLTVDPATREIIYELNKKAFIWADDDVLRWHEGYPKRTGLGGWLGRMRARRVRGRRIKEVPYLVAV